MAVQITLEYANVEEAIAALGKLAGISAAAPKMIVAEKPQPPTVIKPAVLPGADKPPRKPRSDAGQPRGPYKPIEPNAAGASAPSVSDVASGNSTTGTTDAGKTAEAVNPKSTTPAAPNAPAATPPTAATTAPAAPVAIIPTAEQVQHRVESLFNAKGYDDTHATLQRFGVARGKDLKPEQRAEFMVRALDVIEGKLTATGAWPE